MEQTTQSWIQISVCVDSDTSTLLEDAFNQVGALAITFQDSEDEPIFEPELGETPLWSSTRLTALFATPVDIDQILAKVQRQFLEKRPEQLFPHWQIDRLADKDWEREWLKNYQPLEFGPGFWVVPSWLEPPDPDAKYMKIDPGLAFGTGTHETTSLCLSWLFTHRELFSDASLVVDYGCGSGILGIAAAILGAGKVISTDIDPQALIATRQNSDLNGLSDTHLITQQAPYKVAQRPSSREIVENKPNSAPHADLLVANILCEPLIMLSPTFKDILKEGGRIIFSGILTTQCEVLKSHYGDWIVFDTEEVLGDWALISGTAITHA